MRTPCAALDSPLLQAELSPAAGRRADSPPAAARVLDSTAPRRASMARGPGARNARSQAWSHSNTPSRSGVDGRDRAPCPTRASRIQETQEAAPRSPSRSLRRRREWLVGLRQPAHPSREIYQNKSY